MGIRGADQDFARHQFAGGKLGAEALTFWPFWTWLMSTTWSPCSYLVFSFNVTVTGPAAVLSSILPAAIVTTSPTVALPLCRLASWAPAGKGRQKRDRQNSCEQILFHIRYVQFPTVLTQVSIRYT